jgi:hypothetical protein
LCTDAPESGVYAPSEYALFARVFGLDEAWIADKIAKKDLQAQQDRPARDQKV